MNTRFHTAGTATLLAVAAGMLALSGCGGAPASDEVDESASGDVLEIDETLSSQLPDDIRDAGVIRIHTTADYPPNNFADESGDPQGFGIDLGEAIAALLGVQVEWQVSTFDALIPGLEAGRFDVSMASPSITNERLKRIDFVPTIIGASAVGIRSDEERSFTEQTDLCGTHIAAVSGTIYPDVAGELVEVCEEAGLSAPEVSSFPSTNDAMGALRSNRVDVHLAPVGSLLYAASEQPGQFTVVGTELWPEHLGPEAAAFPKGSQLAPVFAEAINELIADGVYGEIADRWGLAEVGIEHAEVNPEVTL